LSEEVEDAMQPVVAPQVDAAANLRRSSVVGAVLGLVSIVVTGVFGHPWMGVFALAGLALGALNNWMLQRSVLRYGADESIGRKQFRNGVLTRLAAVTVLAVALGFFVRPDGLGVFLGLAVFQILMLFGAAVPVFRGLRPTS
jgi:hypothetical protein